MIMDAMKYMSLITGYMNFYNSWLLISIAMTCGCFWLCILTCGSYYYVCQIIRKKGYQIRYKRAFWEIATCSMIASILTIVPVIATILCLNLVKTNANHGVLVYSSWIALGSGVIMMKNALFSILIVYKHKWITTETVQVGQQAQKVTDVIGTIMLDNFQNQIVPYEETSVVGRSQARIKRTPMVSTFGAAPPVGQVQIVYQNVS